MCIRDSPWIGNAIKDLTLVPDTLLAAIQRGDKVVVPKGDTVIEENDLLILAAMGYQDTETIRLKEISITPSHQMCIRDSRSAFCSPPGRQCPINTC